ncbi:major facilitator superfamily domain-containing protein [Phyllosticta citriasiana]|uniref:Major facilitator superfamily domain-containing protein n=1 Tax=Phyllosticta citriasiana TaxID=595635 RepID=A0ABR1KAR5_9PEZI
MPSAHAPGTQPEAQTPPPRRPIGLGWRSSKGFIISTVGMGIYTDMVLYCLIVPVLPFMLEDRIHLREDQLQGPVSFLLAAYAGASVIGSPVTGVIADRWKTRRMPFLLGLTALLLSTILFAVGQTILALTAARALQGLSAAVVWVVGLALLVETVGSDNLGAVIGTIYSIMTVGGLISPALGGALYRHTGYTGVFGVSLAIVIVDFIMRLLVIERKELVKYGMDPSTPKNDNGPPRESEEATYSLPPTENSPLLSARNTSNYELDESYTLPQNSTFLSRNMPIVSLLRSPRLVTALCVGFVQAFLMGTFDSTLPVAAKEIFGFNSLKAGLLYLCLGTFDLIIGPLAGWAVDQLGARTVAMTGFAWLLPVTIAFLAVPGVRTAGKGVDAMSSQSLLDSFVNGAGASTNGSSLPVFCVLLSFCGVGMAIINAPPLVEAGIVVERYHAANPTLFGEKGPYIQLYGLNGMIWNAGLAIGPLVSGALKSALGFGGMMAVIGGICGVAAIATALFMGDRNGKEQRNSEEEEQEG